MIKLEDLLTILPKYEKNNAYGKIGEIKNSVRFYCRRKQLGLQILRFQDLNEDLINNLVVESIDSCSSCGNGHSSSYLTIVCEEIGE